MSDSSRRAFLKLGALGSTSLSAFAQNKSPEVFPIESQNGKLSITSHEKGQVIKPLDLVTITSTEAGYFFIRDGRFRMYRRGDGKTSSVTFRVGGALGNHFCELRNNNGDRMDSIYFAVDCQTEIKDSARIYEELLQSLYWSMIGEWGTDSAFKINNRIYRVLVAWMRDHTHTLKGMKYFYPHLKDNIDLYAEHQRADGMIWDNLYPRTTDPNWWDSILPKDGFIKKLEEGRFELKRQPVEADVEYLFVECLYYSWKATGDFAWMKSRLDSAMKAMRYCTTDKYRWSKKYQLVKRGFTIDTWDFKHEYDNKVTDDANMMINEKTDFGIMFGDSQGLVQAYRFLAEMLVAAGRGSEADYYKNQAQVIQNQIDKVSWNGRFYKHFVPEDEGFFKKRDIGKTDPYEQISMSNSYALNRGIGTEKAVSILKQYQGLKKEMPKTSVGEWYNIYPPFDKGFNKDGENWEYMNGGVSSIVAGELAQGAFQHGFESYGVDILNRTLALARKHQGYLNGTFKGKMPEKKEGNFTVINISKAANADFSGKGSAGVPGWNGDGEGNDISEIPLGYNIFLGIPFQITDPTDNGRKAAIILSDDVEKDYQVSNALIINKKAQTIYLLHARSHGDVIGTLTIRYIGGASHTEYVYGDMLDNWWFPQDKPNFKVGWKGKNKKSPYVGLGITALVNPHPDQEIESLELYGRKNSKCRWMIAGITLGDILPNVASNDKTNDDLSFGIPDRWGAAAVTAALLEGLAGIKDTATMFEKVKISPRWEATNEKEVLVTAKYEASKTYFTYQYKFLNNKLTVLYTGTGTQADWEILLPTGRKPVGLKVNGQAKTYNFKRVESSEYITFAIDNLGVTRIEVEF